MSWQLASFVLLSIVLAAGFAWYERTRPPARVVALVAALAALATVGRLAFAPIPNVKPTTDIALFAGYALGPVPGFAVGAIAALASNVFFGQGPWTPWQMLGWGLAGVIGGLLRSVTRRELGRFALAAACAFAGLVFGALLDFYQWTQGATHDLAAYFAWSATSLPYNLAHIMGNIAFCLLLGPTFVHALGRFRRRFEVRWAPAAAATLVLAVLVTGAAMPPGAEASPASRAAAYLEQAQNADGGFGGAPGSSSNSLHTGWAGLGLAGAGVNPADVENGGKSVLDYVRASIGATNDTGELERTILVITASGAGPRDFEGRDLVAELLRRRSRNGSWQGNNTWTSFGILALRGAGAGGVGRSTRWLARQQNRDGGFGFRPHAASSVDDTGAAMQALAAGGRRGTKVVRRAARYLRSTQNRDGGFPLLRRQTSNSQSTSWAVQGLVAVGRDPAAMRRAGRSPLRYLRSLQGADGSVRFSRSSRQTPVWTTAQAADAFARKAFPIAAPARRASAEESQPGKGRESGGAAAQKNRKAGSPEKPAAEPAQPAPAPAPAPAASAAPPSADVAQASAETGADDGGNFAWGPAVGAAALAAVAAFAVWRLARRRGLSV